MFEKTSKAGQRRENIKIMFKKLDRSMWAGFIRLRLETSTGILEISVSLAGGQFLRQATMQQPAKQNYNQ